MKVIGQILKAEREKRNVSLNEVAVATKVSLKILQAIEDGDHSNLPQKTFLRGFVRSYAQYLKLDIAQIMDQFQTEMGSTNPKNLLLPSEKAEPRADAAEGSASPANYKSPELGKRAQPMTKVAIGVALVLIAVVSFVLKKTVDKYEGESASTVPTGLIAALSTTTSTSLLNQATDLSAAGGSIPPATTSADGAGFSSSTITAAATASSTTLAAVAVMASSSSSTSSSTTSTTKPPATTTTVKATTTTTASPSTTVVSTTSVRTTAVSTTAVSTTVVTSTTAPKSTTSTKPNSAVDPIAAPPGAATESEKSQEVIIEALDNLTVQARMDGGKISSVTLKANDVYTFKSKGKIALDISDGGVVSVVYNGKDKGVPGVLGKPIKLKFP
jgi:cytoskeleton protein RodZ